MSASVVRGRGRDEEKYEEGDRAHGNMGPQRDMGEELGREDGTTMITTTILHPHPHATRNKTCREEIELTVYTQGHKSNSAYAMDLFLGFQL